MCAVQSENSNHIERLATLDFVIERSQRNVDEAERKGQLPTEAALHHLMAMKRARIVFSERLCQLDVFSSTVPQDE